MARKYYLILINRNRMKLTAVCSSDFKEQFEYMEYMSNTKAVVVTKTIVNITYVTNVMIVLEV